jgi:CRISPR-associated protein Cas1
MPLSDVGVVVASNPGVTCTLAALAGVCAAGGAFVACDDRRLPVGMMLPLQGHHLQTERIAIQVAAKLPVRKRLWQQIVQAKLRAQAACLTAEVGTDSGILALARRVRSGDPDNLEAQAARKYWASLLAEWNFRRDQEGEGLNAVLNYGYTVLRAMTGRAVCAVGLHPSIGLHHHNRYSQFVLADDLMEPFRVVVDRAAVQVARTWGADAALDRNVKTIVFESLNARYRLDGQERTLSDILGRASTSIVEVLAGRAKRACLPEFERFFTDSEG